MSKRERTLVIVLVSFGALVVTAKVVYPSLIRPVFDLSDQIAAKERERARLEEELYKFDADIVKYRQYVLRTGGTDANSVKDEFYQRINELIQRSQLHKVRLAPKTPREDRKTRLQTVGFTVTAQGSWRDAIQFIQRFYELPYVAQVTDLKLTPAGGRRQSIDRVKIAGTIEVHVLPDDKAAGTIAIPEESGDEVRVKYSLARADVSWLLGRQPFRTSVKPLPPRVKTPERIVRVPEPDTGPRFNLDPNRTRKFIRQIWSFGRDEVLVQNDLSRQTEWITTGDSLDGGKVVLVHPLGAVVSRPGGDHYVYPLGYRLSDCMRLQDAIGFPEIRLASMALPEVRNALTAGKDDESSFVGPPADAGTNGFLADAGTNGEAGTNGIPQDAGGETVAGEDMSTNGLTDEAGTNGISREAGTSGVDEA